MKNNIKISLLIILLSFLNLEAQFTKLWEKSAGSSYPWFINDNNTKSIAYDSVNNYLYILSLKGGKNIFVLDPNNGNVVDTLNTSIVAGGLQDLNLVRVDENGIIYACNLAADNDVLKIYRWANKDAVPTVACFLLVTTRTGDAFSVKGKGVDTRFYLSGSSASDIKVFKTLNGTVFSLEKTINLPSPSLAAGAIIPVSNTTNTNIWIKNINSNAILINQNGQILDSIPDRIVSKAFNKINSFTFESNQFILANCQNNVTNGLRFTFSYSKTSQNLFSYLGFGTLTNTYNTNSSALGDIEIKKNNDGTFTIFSLITNNGLAAFKTNGLINFSINMKNLIFRGEFNPADGDKVFIRGSFNGWSLNDTLADDNNDTIFSKIVNIGELGYKEFKFYYKKNNGTEFWESDPNRSFTFTKFFADFYGWYFNGVRDSIYWCNLQWPPTLTSNAGDTVIAYARVYAANITPIPGASNRIKAWIGTSPINNHPSNNNWSWKQAPYNVQHGNDDEYMGKFGFDLPAGTYYYASRFQCDDQTYVYGGYSQLGGGIWDSVNYVSGVLTINATTICQTIKVLSDWNIVSVPLQSPNMFKDSLFKNSISSAFGFNGSYFSTDTLKNGVGYWLKFPANDSVKICGLPNPNTSINVTTGWNLIGLLNYNILASNITSNPPNIISSPFFGYEYGYIQPAILQSGKGYWVKVSQNGTLIFPPANQMLKENLSSKIPDNKSTITLKDAYNREFNLFLTNESISFNNFELPPQPPSQIFDVRFISNRYIENSEQQNVICINGASYPIQLSVDKGTYILRDKITGQLLNAILDKNNPVLIKNNSINQISIEPVIISDKLILEQNFPNPFNGSTKINFYIPNDNLVTLKIFDITGKELYRLENKKYNQGFHSIDIDANNFSSGIYFYQISAGNFISTKKMIILK